MKLCCTVTSRKKLAAYKGRIGQKPGILAPRHQAAIPESLKPLRPHCPKVDTWVCPAHLSLRRCGCPPPGGAQGLLKTQVCMDMRVTHLKGSSPTMVLCPLPCDKETVKTKEASSTSHPQGLALLEVTAEP